MQDARAPRLRSAPDGSGPPVQPPGRYAGTGGSRTPGSSGPADVDAGRLDEFRGVRIELHPPGPDLGPDVTIGEEHASNLPVPVRCLREYGLEVVSGGAGLTRGCSSMVEHQLPKLTVRVRFPSSALSGSLVVAIFRFFVRLAFVTLIRVDHHLPRTASWLFRARIRT